MGGRFAARVFRRATPAYRNAGNKRAGCRRAGPGDERKTKREGKTVDQVADESTTTIPVGRYSDPQEYADVVAFLASTPASYVTGSIIRVDGGLIASI